MLFIAKLSLLNSTFLIVVAKFRLVHIVKVSLVKAKILFLFTKLRGESELERGGGW